MKKTDKIFVAGHNGLVGSSLIRRLQNAGFFNIITRSHEELDLRDQKKTYDFFREETPAYVFLAAAKVGGIAYNQQFPADFMYDNLTIQTNVIEGAYRNKAKKLLFLGSACIYPKITPQPIKEEYLLTAALEPTNEAYALAKIAGLRMCQHYKRQHGFNAISVMPANLYGVNDNFFPDRCHVIPGLINKFSTAKDNGDPTITAWGDGSPTREFLYVDDLADACIFLMQEYNDIEHINIGTETEITIKDLSEIIKKEVGFEGEIFWDHSKPNGTPRRKLDNSRLEKLGWKPKVPFDVGLKRTITWFNQNRDKFR